MKRHALCKLDIFQEIELSNLYSVGFSTWMLSKFFKVAQSTANNTIHRLHEIGLIPHVRGNEESVRVRYRLEGKAKPIPLFPASEYVRTLVQRGVGESFDILIAAILLTDGHIYKDQIWLTSDSEVMHRLFFDMIYHRFNVKPSSFRKGKRGNTTFYARKETAEVINRLRSLTPSFKTTPALHQTEEEYLSKTQPTLDFVVNSSTEVQIEALRLSMCAEGSITPFLNNGHVRGVLSFACTHPVLVNQWHEILHTLGFNGFYTALDPNMWSGVSGIRTCSNKDLEKFLSVGGFINGIKIGRGSPYYCGLDKQSLLIALLEYQNKNKKVAISLKDLHTEIRKIAERVT